MKEMCVWRVCLDQASTPPFPLPFSYLQGRLLPRVREEYDAFEALTLDAIAKMKEEVREIREGGKEGRREGGPGGQKARKTQAVCIYKRAGKQEMRLLDHACRNRASLTSPTITSSLSPGRGPAGEAQAEAATTTQAQKAADFFRLLIVKP
jgi:hypothetical protein